MIFLDSIIWVKKFIMANYSLFVYPLGALHVLASMWMYCITHQIENNSAAKVASNLAYDNYIADMQAWETYGLSYEVYMVNIID